MAVGRTCIVIEKVFKPDSAVCHGWTVCTLRQCDEEREHPSRYLDPLELPPPWCCSNQAAFSHTVLPVTRMPLLHWHTTAGHSLLYSSPTRDGLCHGGADQKPLDINEMAELCRLA